MNGWRVGAAAVAAVFTISIAGEVLAKRKKKGGAPDELEQLVNRISAGRNNFFYRNTPDTDASPYIGRFVPDGTAALDVDDALSVSTSCSEFISHRVVGGGDVQYDEYFNASTSVATKLGVPKLVDLGADVSYDGGTIVRVRYTLTRKMVAETTDHEALADCCAAAPGRCTNLYLGEFIEGTGEVFQMVGSATDVDVGIGNGDFSVGTEVKDGMAWSRSVAFTKPVYFAFKTTELLDGTIPEEYLKQFEPCGDWRTLLPTSTRGQYFVGLSEIVASEKLAREMGRRDARVQAVEYLGDRVRSGNMESTVTGGMLQQLQSMFQQESITETQTEGVASLVKDMAWCVEPQRRNSGYKVWVLSFFPHSAEAEWAADVTGSAAPTPHSESSQGDDLDDFVRKIGGAIETENISTNEGGIASLTTLEALLGDYTRNATFDSRTQIDQLAEQAWGFLQAFQGTDDEAQALDMFIAVFAEAKVIEDGSLRRVEAPNLDEAEKRRTQFE